MTFDFQNLRTPERIAHEAGVDVATVQAAALTSGIEPDFIAARAMYSAESAQRIQAHLTKEQPVTDTDHEPTEWPAAFIARLAANAVAISDFEQWPDHLRQPVIEAWNAEQEQQEDAADEL